MFFSGGLYMEKTFLFKKKPIKVKDGKVYIALTPVTDMGIECYWVEAQLKKKSALREFLVQKGVELTD